MLVYFRVLSVMLFALPVLAQQPASIDAKQTAPAAVSQQPVIQMPMIPRIGTADRSGATPSPGSNISGDTNDPLMPHDSGIYLYTKDGGCMYTDRHPGSKMEVPARFT